MSRRRGRDENPSRGRDRLVWSDARGGRVRESAQAPRRPRGDGVVRVRREVKGRRGKPVTTAAGIPLADDALRELAAELKRRCGSGGAVKDGVVEIQGDHRALVVEILEARGFPVKRAGG